LPKNLKIDELCMLSLLSSAKIKSFHGNTESNEIKSSKKRVVDHRTFRLRARRQDIGSYASKGITYECFVCAGASNAQMTIFWPLRSVCRQVAQAVAFGRRRSRRRLAQEHNSRKRGTCHGAVSLCRIAWVKSMARKTKSSCQNHNRSSGPGM
jgi:hypothetical protein